MDTPRISSLIKGSIWAIREEKLEAILDVVEAKRAGVELPPLQAAEPGRSERRQGIAIMPLRGIIGQRMNMIMEFSGGTSAEIFNRDLQAFLGDPEIGGVLVDIDSPGGEVFGTPELAEQIFAARAKKPIFGVANATAASAAYWIGSAVEELAVTPSGEVGSIGVYALHTDISEAESREGIKRTYIKAGRLKTVGNSYEPLTDESRSYIQDGVDRYYEMFTAAVARHRGVDVKTVREKFGEGGMVGAADAVARGMADRVATLDEMAGQLLSRVNGGAGARQTAKRTLSDAELRRRMAIQ